MGPDGEIAQTSMIFLVSLWWYGLLCLHGGDHKHMLLLKGSPSTWDVFLIICHKRTKREDLEITAQSSYTQAHWKKKKKSISSLMLHRFNFLQRSALQKMEKYTGKTRRCLVKYLSVGRMLPKKTSNTHKPCKNLGCLFSTFRASCVQQLGVRLPLKAIISCSSRLRGLTAHHKHLTVLLTVFFFRLVPRLLLQLHPPAAKSRPAGIIGPPVHLFLPFSLPESSSSHMHWGREGGTTTH